MSGYKRIKPTRIGFISTRFAGTDGVSLETDKWAEVLQGLGHDCFYFGGIVDRPEPIRYVVPEADFHYTENILINNAAFSLRSRPPEITQKIYQLKEYLKEQLVHFIRRFDLQLLIVENALSIPMHLPLGLALTEFLAETSFPTIGHHHDMFWERKRFLVNCVWDYLNMAFPPHLPGIQHVVINSSASNQLSLRTGISSMIIPNVMDFDHPPQPMDEFGRNVRSDLGLSQDEYFILQPTRIVQRKGIEHAIELVDRLGLKARLVISEASGDEGDEYEKRIQDYAALLKVPALYISDIVQEHRGYTPDGRRIYTLSDLYLQSDLVTYPSDIEGFGNAFLETVYYKRPIVVNNYSIFDIDIKPKGFQVIDFDGYITEKTVEKARQILLEPNQSKEMTEHNYAVASQYYSFTTLARNLETLLSRIFGE